MANISENKPFVHVGFTQREVLNWIFADMVRAKHKMTTIVLVAQIINNAKCRAAIFAKMKGSSEQPKAFQLLCSFERCNEMAYGWTVNNARMLHCYHNPPPTLLYCSAAHRSNVRPLLYRDKKKKNCFSQ